jgi:3-methyl-2-oxobutanoate hydroxymethyltransferase
MGHLGLTPQSVMMLGGYVAQGRTAADALRLVDDALLLQDAGCFLIVLEAIPAPVAGAVTAALTIPTVGIGAGVSCDGQVLVWHDLLGISQGHVPRFVKPYAGVGATTLEALQAYVADVRAARFPEPRHTYGMPEDELARFQSAVATRK